MQEERHLSFDHKRSGITYFLRVRVSETLHGFEMLYSMTCRPIEGGRPWFSDSHSFALDKDEIDDQVQSWVGILEDSYEVIEWSNWGSVSTASG